MRDRLRRCLPGQALPVVAKLLALTSSTVGEDADCLFCGRWRTAVRAGPGGRTREQAANGLRPSLDPLAADCASPWGPAKDAARRPP